MIKKPEKKEINNAPFYQPEDNEIIEFGKKLGYNQCYDELVEYVVGKLQKIIDSGCLSWEYEFIARRKIDNLIKEWDDINQLLQKAR